MILCAALAAVPCVAHAAPDEMAPATQPTDATASALGAAGTAAGTATVSEATALWSDAMIAFNNGDFASAADIASKCEVALRKAKVKPTEAGVVNAIHLQAVSLMRQGNHRKAGDTLQRIFAQAATNRSVLMNLAVCDLVQTDLLARSLKTLQTYAITHPDDEGVVDLWGAAIDAWEQTGKAPPSKVKEAWTAYGKANTRLEATRAEERRWGTEWKPKAEVVALEAQNRQQMKAVDAATAEWKEAVIRLDRAKAQRKAAEETMMQISDRSEHHNYWHGHSNCGACKRARAQSEFDQATSQINYWMPKVETTRTRVDRELSELVKPTWAVALEPVEMELLR